MPCDRGSCGPPSVMARALYVPGGDWGGGTRCRGPAGGLCGRAGRWWRKGERAAGSGPQHRGGGNSWTVCGDVVLEWYRKYSATVRGRWCFMERNLGFVFAQVPEVIALIINRRPRLARPRNRQVPPSSPPGIVAKVVRWRVHTRFARTICAHDLCARLVVFGRLAMRTAT